MSAPDPASQWSRALAAAAVVAIDPAGIGGVHLRAQSGPGRDMWLAAVRRFAGDRQLVKMPASIDESRLLGGLDLVATLSAGRPVAAQGLLAGAHNGIVVAAMAERLPALTAAHLASVLDRGAVVVERDGVAMVAPARIGLVALDESIEEERLAASLADRLAIVLDFGALSSRDIAPADESMVRAVVEARRHIGEIECNDDVLSAFCRAALSLGIASLRAPLQAVAVARGLAAFDGRAKIDDDDARMAAALVLAPRAVQMPVAEDEPAPDDMPPDDPSPQQSETTPLDDVVMEAAQAALPPGLLAKLAAGDAASRAARQRGKAGARNFGTHGRKLGARSGPLRGGARLDLVATLRAAAPWQGLRRLEGASREKIAIRADDIRIARFEDRTRTVTIFLVDASGSAARERLAEAKGAVRLMLADCYIRRDEVALMAFRRDGAEILLPPTRSLVRAERALAALPGGGGTPLAAGLDAAAQLARAEAVRGRTPPLGVMSDGRANVARDGSGGRPRAHEDALDAAKSWRATGFASAFIDTSATPGAQAAAVAAAMGARYVALPHADARGVDAAVRALGRAS